MESSWLWRKHTYFLEAKLLFMAPENNVAHPCQNIIRVRYFCSHGVRALYVMCLFSKRECFSISDVNQINTWWKYGANKAKVTAIILVQAS